MYNTVTFCWEWVKIRMSENSVSKESEPPKPWTTLTPRKSLEDCWSTLDRKTAESCTIISLTTRSWSNSWSSWKKSWSKKSEKRSNRPEMKPNSCNDKMQIYSTITHIFLKVGELTLPFSLASSSGNKFLKAPEFPGRTSLLLYSSSLSKSSCSSNWTSDGFIRHWTFPSFIVPVFSKLNRRAACS